MFQNKAHTLMAHNNLMNHCGNSYQNLTKFTFQKQNNRTTLKLNKKKN